MASMTSTNRLPAPIRRELQVTMHNERLQAQQAWQALPSLFSDSVTYVQERGSLCVWAKQVSYGLHGELKRTVKPAFVIDYETSELVFILLSTPFSFTIRQQERLSRFGEKRFFAGVHDLSRPEIEARLWRSLGRHTSSVHRSLVVPCRSLSRLEIIGESSVRFRFLARRLVCRLFGSRHASIEIELDCQLPLQFRCTNLQAP
jgi:hypothetical protein